MLTLALYNLITGIKHMDKRILLILFIIIILYLCVMIVLFLKERTRRLLWKSMGGYQGRIKLSDKLFTRMYLRLKTFPFTRDYMEKLSFQFRLICPCDSKVIARITMISCLISFFLCLLVVLLIFLTNPQLITLITAIFAISILNSEIVGSMAKNFEITLNLETQQLIENEIHNYYVNYRVDDALYHSLDNLSPNMRFVAEQIYKLFLSDDKEAALMEYYENIPNKYLREFVSLCVGVSERGDQTVEGKYLFVRNMENLYAQLEIEIDKLQRLKMEFMGVMMIVILPIFCINIVKWFCISIKSNMEAFYFGKEGFLIDIALLVITTVIYIVMHKSAEYRTFHQSKHKWLYAIDRIPIVKKAMDNYCDKNASSTERLKRRLKNGGYNIRARHFILRKFLIAGGIFWACIGVSFYLNWAEREKLLIVDMTFVETLTSAAKESQYTDMQAIIETYTREYLTKRANTEKAEITKEEIISQLKSEGIFYNNIINEVLAKEIVRRVEKYKALRFDFFDLLFSFLFSLLAFYAPDILMKYNSSISKDAMEDEVNQFNALIGMLIYDKCMTVKQVLIEMESYAVVFKQSIRTCINDYGSGDIIALQQLKEEEPYPPLNRIVDNLIRCDDMPIYEAFHEVDMEREGYLSKRRLANEKSIKRRVMRAYFLAAVPLILLFAYGVIPTLVFSMNEISAVLASLDSVW